MLGYGGAKMSKSLGNLVLVSDLLRTYPGDAIRHYLVARHYRSEVDFIEGDLARAADAAALLRRACLRAEELAPAEPALAAAAALHPRVAEHRERFLAAMDDDLDTPRAMPELVALAMLALESDDPSLAAQAGWMVRELGTRILGLRLATVPALRATAAA
jgi:cysteinyl-tRNA synthetase